MAFKKFINLKGGVVLNKEWQSNPEGALFYFIENCKKVKIIFDKSASCVCYKFYDLPLGIISPYVSIRSTNLEQPVTSILFKIGLISNSFRHEYLYFERSRHHDKYNSKIVAVLKETVTEEITSQHDVYIKSSNLSSESPLEPICPAIICYSLDINFDGKKFIFDSILNKLEQRDGGVGIDKTYKISDVQVTTNLQNVKNKISIIVMEFMDGYENLSEYYRRRHKRLEYFKLMHHYELYKLGCYGYLHMDSHWENVMINPEYPYFTNNKDSKMIGKALIVDFGIIKNIKGRNIENEIVNQYEKQTFKGLIRGGQIIEPVLRDHLDTLRATMKASFLAKLDEKKKEDLLLLFIGNKIMLDFKKTPKLKSGKMIQDEMRIESERKESERKESERKESERKESERKESERKESERNESERKESERKESERKESERKESERKESEQALLKAKEESKRRDIEESEEEIFYSALTTQKEPEDIEEYVIDSKTNNQEPTNVLKQEQNNQNIGEPAYIKVTGNLPSASPIHNSFNLWNWASIFVVNAAETGAIGKLIEFALNKGGNGDQNCPNLSIDINKIPKCFKSQKEFRDMALILHPDQNNNCSKEDQLSAIEKFKKLNSNKEAQNNVYGKINENTYEICTSSDDSTVNIKKESEELENLKNKQEKMDSLYLESMKGKEISNALSDKIFFIFNLCNEKGKNNINEINNIFETILEELYEVLDFKKKNYETDLQSISDDNLNITKSRITVENLKKNVTQKIKEYREQISFLLRENSINIVPESENLLITCIIDVAFRNYLINIETLNNAINYIDGLINIKNGNKMNLLYICFGIPQNLQITQNGDVGNELTTINNNTQITSVFNQNVPLYGLKYEIATTPLISLIKKYKIGTINVENLNITSEQFNNNITNIFNKPFVLKNIPLTGGKINKQKLIKYNKTIKNKPKTKKKRKNKKTKRRC
jgi:hypothetical protein